MGIFKNWLDSKNSDSPSLEHNSFDEIVENLADGDRLLIFKASPRCFTSLSIENMFDEWYQENMDNNLKLLKVNVVSQRPLSNMIAEKYEIVHESPQLIWLDNNEKIIWHGSHHLITVDVLDQLLNGQIK